jgi:nucleoside-diphosphate-sugar epimerase
VSTAERTSGVRETSERAPVLVTGASGFLGRSLVQRLLADGYPTRVLVRTNKKGEDLAAAGAQVIVGEISDRVALDVALDGAATVYHLAGRLFCPSTSAAVYYRTHVVGTELLLSRCLHASGVRRLVHCSTTGVIGLTGETPADEDAPLRPTNAYEETKAEAEQAVRAASCDGLPVVIVRPGLVYGPGDMHLLGFFRAVLGGRFRPIGPRPVMLHPIYIDDLTEAFLRCGCWPLAVGECFNIAGQAPVSLGELASTIALAGGVRPSSGTIPLWVARTAGTFGDLLPRRLRRYAPLTRSRVAFLTNSRVYDITKARVLLDFAAPTELATGVARAMRWYYEHGYLPQPSNTTVADQLGTRCGSETT